MLGRMLALGVTGGRVMLVDEATGEERWEVQAHAVVPSSMCVAMSPSNGRFVASASNKQGEWKLLDAASGAECMTGARHDGTGACSCRVTRSGRISLDEGCPVEVHFADLNRLAFSPCGARLASGGYGGVVILWDAHTGTAEQRIQGASACGT